LTAKELFFIQIIRGGMTLKDMVRKISGRGFKKLKAANAHD